MKKNSFKIKYKKSQAKKKSTKLFFFEGKPDLEKLFLKEKKSFPKKFKKKSGTPFPNARQNSRRLFVADENVSSLESVQSLKKHFSKKADFFSEEKKLYLGSGEFLDDAFLEIKAGEKFKTVDTVLKIAAAALDLSFSREDIFVAIGGGVATDVVAFSASIFKRGARCEFVPTTLLAMVDAAVGGKCGCDFAQYKNMAGSFFPAEKIFVFPEFAKTLSDAEFRSGFAEAFKTALLFEKKLFKKISAQKEKIFLRENDFIFLLVKKCVRAKSRIVQKDLFEKNIRMLLNLGHTFGHALETCAGLGKIAHGDAVAWGISRALQASSNLGLCSSKYAEEVFSLLKFFGWEAEKTHSAFSEENSAQKILSAMKRDKKNSSAKKNEAKVRLVLQKGLCKNFIAEVCDEEILKCL